MIGLVVVSHSPKVADGIGDIAAEMSADNHIETA